MDAPWTSADSTFSVLFICTGNYYRSRHAEAYFNWRAKNQGLAARAFSRGLLTSMVAEEPTRLSPSTAERLKHLGIPLTLTAPEPVQLTQGDLMRAHRSVALRRDEHRALMSLQHPEWADQIEYWDVKDIDELEAELALPRIETQVEQLLKLYA